MEISRMLTINTCHITERTAAMLNSTPSRIPLPIYPKGEFGWFIYLDNYTINQKEQIREIPSELWNCLMLVKRKECNWLCLDCDGEEIDELQGFDW